MTDMTGPALDGAPLERSHRRKPVAFAAPMSGNRQKLVCRNPALNVSL
jgi:hypothetical protein